MCKKILSNVALPSGKAVYESPVSKGYEIELEGAILDILSQNGGDVPSMKEEDPWS